MKYLVEDALRNADDTEADISVDNPNADELGTPVCAVIGCGTAGINRVELVDDPDATAVIGDSEILDKVAGNSETQIPVVTRDHASEYRVLNYPDLESAVAAIVGDPDTVVVTGHLDTTESILTIETVCRQFSSETTVVAAPSVPQEGLPTDGKKAFVDLTYAAGVTIPYELNAADGISQTETTAGNDPHELTNMLVAEMINDVFDIFRNSMAAPVLRWDAAHDLFNNGGVALSYWGWAQRQNDAESVIEHVASNRVCDGDSQTAIGGFGFVRFGESFTLAEFETLRETAMELIAPSHVEDDRWVFCGDSTLHQNDEYRLFCLLFHVNLGSLEFI